MKKCLSCGTEYSNSTFSCPKDHCPNCGTTRLNGRYKVRDWFEIGVLVILSFAFGAVGGPNVYAIFDQSFYYWLLDLTSNAQLRIHFVFGLIIAVIVSLVRYF